MSYDAGNFGDFGHTLYETTGIMIAHGEGKKEELAGLYDSKLNGKRDLTELSRLLSNKIEENNQVEFKEADKLRAHITKVKATTDVDLEEWDDFLTNKTNTVASWVLKIMNSSVDYHKKSISLDLERAALHMQDLAQKEKMVYDGLGRMNSDLNQMRRSFLTVGRHR